MVKMIKKAFKWYLNQTAKTYAFTPSCIIPIKISK